MTTATSPFSHGSSLNPFAPGALYTGTAQPLTGALLPAQARPGMTVGGPRERRTGLIPMAPDSGGHVTIIKAVTAETRVGAEKVASLKTALRKAQKAEQDAQDAYMDDQSEANGKTYVDLQNRAALALKVYTMASARGVRPTQVFTLKAQDPSAVPEAFGDAEHLPRWVCTHDGCREQRWETERDLRIAHPTASVMRSNGAAHVYGLYSDAPMDPEDPDGGCVGLIAPVGSDGLTAAQVATAYLTGESHQLPAGELPPPQEIPKPSARAVKK